VVEETLMRTEELFVAVLPKIRERRTLGRDDLARLCIFTAAMQARTNSMGRRVKDFLGGIHELVAKDEQKHNAQARTSLETVDIARHANQRMIQSVLRALPQMLFRMSVVILETDDRVGD
jgi:hypothetical protein